VSYEIELNRSDVGYSFPTFRNSLIGLERSQLEPEVLRNLQLWHLLYLRSNHQLLLHFRNMGGRVGTFMGTLIPPTPPPTADCRW
jgi:hypothetical protein